VTAGQKPSQPLARATSGRIVRRTASPETHPAATVPKFAPLPTRIVFRT
jgi:hypothetical protein